MKKYFLSVSVLLAFGVIWGMSLPAGGQEYEIQLREKAKKVDAILQDWNSPGSPGATVAVVHDGRIVYSRGFGLANLEYDIPNTPETIYHIASISKQFTVFAVLLLEQQGKLSFDDDIRTYIPEVPDFGDKITLRHLASHTSGLRDQWNLLGMAGWRLDDVITTEHVLTFTSRQKELNFPPGERFLYSNTGFTLLGEVVARVSGMTFNEFAIRHIFEPLGMKNTFFYDDHERIVPNRAYSYYSIDHIYKKSVLSYANAGATSLFTTAEDLGRWVIFMNRPDTEKAPLIEKMNEKGVLNNGEEFGGALGQFVDEYRGLHRIQHGGADAGYRTFMARFPNQDFAVIILSNYARFNPARYASLITDIYLDDFVDSEEQKPLYDADEYLSLDSAILKQYEGYFVNHFDATSRNLVVSNNKLLFSSGNFYVPLVPVSDKLFWFPGTQTTIRFANRGNQMTASIQPSQPPAEFVRELPVSYSAEELKAFTGTYFSEELQTTYSIEIDECKLIARHVRTGDVLLTPVFENLFRGESWYLGTVRFQEKDGSITGFRASSGRVWNMWFEKIQ